MGNEPTYEELITRIGELQGQLFEAQETIDAIRAGEVDAFIVKGETGPELYTLKSADQTYRIIIEKMTDGAVTLNRDNIIIYSNSSFATMLDLPLEYVLGVCFEDLVVSEYRETVGQLIKTAWKEDCKAEVFFQGKDNKLIPVLLSLNRLEISGDPVVSVIITDLSFQKETQEQKHALEKKDEFITIASHELKTPVTSIKGYLQLLRYNFLQEGKVAEAELLNKADTQVNKLTSLISDLLDVKKIENGQLQYNIDVFNFNELVNEIVEETRRVLKTQTIKTEIEDNSFIEGDRNKIGQVITNLIDNAKKYSPSDSVIEIKTFKTEHNIALEVKDRGIGIPKDQQHKIFERFFRVEGEKENTYAGLGLGLYICAEIVKRHNGTIGVNSEKGKGSIFYFELPIYE